MINPNIESRINAINSRMVARKSIISARRQQTNYDEDDHGDEGGAFDYRHNQSPVVRGVRSVPKDLDCAVETLDRSERSVVERTRPRSAVTRRSKEANIE